MMIIKNCIFLVAAALSISSIAQGMKNEPLFGSSQLEEPKIFVNNRILARVNGKPISTFDLMKKMDLAFYRQYPQYTSSLEARAQYYQANWRFVLEDMIDKELILADAKESKIEVSSGDVRQEMEAAFGPNIIMNLDKAGLTFEEASKIMQEEILIQRMISGRVHSKVIRQVTPNRVKLAYEEFIKDPGNARLTQWTYRIITIKERNPEKMEEVAKTAYQMLMDGNQLEELPSRLKENKLLGRKGNITVSGVIKQNDREIVKDYRDMMIELEPGMYSQPFAHKSRKSSGTVYRILYIQEKIPGGIPSFKEMEGRLKGKLLDQLADEETIVYLRKLRQHYHIREDDLKRNIPYDYKPFTLNR